MKKKRSLESELLCCVYGTLNGRVEFKEQRHGEMKGELMELLVIHAACERKINGNIYYGWAKGRERRENERARRREGRTVS